MYRVCSKHGKYESNLLKNMTQGAAPWVLLKTSRTFASDSPNHIARSSGPCRGRSATTNKYTLRQRHTILDERSCFVCDCAHREHVDAALRLVGGCKSPSLAQRFDSHMTTRVA